MSDSEQAHSDQVNSEGREPLGFYDHHRQSYKHLPLRDGHEAEFMIGGYGDGVDHRGEFMIACYRFRSREKMTPQVCVFTDAVDALEEFIGLGGLRALRDTPIETRDDLSRLLLSLGLRDLSNDPLPVTPAMIERGLEVARQHWTAAEGDDVRAVLQAALSGGQH